MKSYNELKEKIWAQQNDITSIVERGNKSAARRVRKALSEIAKECKLLRAEIQEKIKG